MAHRLPVAHGGSRLNRLQWGKINIFRAIVYFRQVLRTPKCIQLPSLQLPIKKTIFKMPSPCGDDKCKDKTGGDCKCKCGSDCKCGDSGSAEKCNCKCGGECTCKQGGCQC